jgi:putative salt-induced outer membrane protein YdiY
VFPKEEIVKFTRSASFPAALGMAMLASLGASARKAFAEGPPPIPPVWSGQADLSYLQTSGNSRTQAAGAGLDVLYQSAPWKSELKAAFLRAAAEDTETARRFSAALRGERSLTPRFSVYAQGSYLRDLFAGIRGQEILEGGGLYKIVPGPVHTLSGSLGAGYAWEQREPPAENRNFLAAIAGLSYRWKITPTSEFGEDVNYLRDLKTSDDWRFNMTTSLAATVSKKLALKLSHQLLYTNSPVPGKKKTDTAVTAALVVKF